MIWFRSKPFRLLIVAVIASLGVLCWIHLAPQLEVFFLFLRSVLTPFLLAAIISYLLYPAVRFLHIKTGISQIIAILFVYLVLIGIGALLIVLALPTLERQIEQVLKNLPMLGLQVQEFIQSSQDHGREMLPQFIWKAAEQTFSKIEYNLTAAFENFMGGFTGILDKLFTILIVPFLSFHILKDAHMIELRLFKALPTPYRYAGLQLFYDLDTILGRYIRGQLLLCSIIFIASYISYTLIDLPYALLLAGVVGITNIIPYLGPFLGAFPAVLVTLLINPHLLPAVLMINLLIQAMEGSLLSPHIMGKTLNLHPIVVILALLVGGEIGGLMGLLLALPVTAMGKVILRHLQSYMISRHGIKKSSPRSLP